MQNIKYLKDYTEVYYHADTIKLIFNIDVKQQVVYVENTTNYTINKHSTSMPKLILNGSSELTSIALNQKILINEIDYFICNDELIINNQLLSDNFTIIIKTQIYPWVNKSCMGLYMSHNDLITQCEPEGFRKITHHQDRPDVLSIFFVDIITSIECDYSFNTILSNGNKIVDKIDNTTNLRHVSWHDPFKKPCYLFALVIGNFDCITNTYTTKSNKTVDLTIYAKNHHIANLNYAMQALKRSMQWDEVTFNLEYDLDHYMIVASSDFNSGAMENKGLNIFNTKYLLANRHTTTDREFIDIEAVIAHEYFHNWTGNRVTCRDWFQLSLKEGLTVFRDQEFTASLHGASTKRILDVAILRNKQFAEDASPLAHPVRPDHYLQINNFYTITVYEKGAEIVRMYQTILGKVGFKNGLALYLQLCDSRAVTCEDFYQAMCDANNVNLAAFMLWYTQYGTPILEVTDKYDYSKQEYIIEFTQILANKDFLPHLIPVKLGLLNAQGYDVPINSFTITADSDYKIIDNELILLINNFHNTFIFNNITTKPTPSILRDFSAPVKINYNYTITQRLFLINHDTNEFNCFNQIQEILTIEINRIYKLILNKEDYQLNQDYINIFANIIKNPNLKPQLIATAFTLPSFYELLGSINNVNPQIFYQVINFIMWELGELLFDVWVEVYNLCLRLDYHIADYGLRSLKNTALLFIASAISYKLHNPKSVEFLSTLIRGQFNNANNMTDIMGAMLAINNIDFKLRNDLLQQFYDRWHHDENVIDKWFILQASSHVVTIKDIDKLITNKAFIATNSNKIYALLRTFTLNYVKFHTIDGYTNIIDKVIAIDKFNPQVASSLINAFSYVTNLDKSYQLIVKNILQNTLEQPLSNHVFEKIDKILK